MPIRIHPDPKTKTESGHCLACGVSMLWRPTKAFAHPAPCPYCGEPLAEERPEGGTVWRSIDGASHPRMTVVLLPAAACPDVSVFRKRRAKL